MSKSVWIHIIFGNACSTLGLWVEKIGGSEIFLILIPYLGPLVHSVMAKLSENGTGCVDCVVSLCNWLASTYSRLRREETSGQPKSEVTSINIYAAYCALLRRCLSMAKTFFHVFNLWFEMVRDWENVAISTGMSRRLQLDLWRTKFLLYRYCWAPAYSWSLPSKPKHYRMFYHPS